ncbi:general glycosylation pathway protein [candidate division TA06 bacterium DG_78]|uniref:General glycosylation pathway protein n=1 Tax=candidate division TA06 bacterium DG_78 TaxID=1703772 RepID=A0A0S7YDB7_UNCT6|nr:MAG: general glycosylation pathway protein [candidate division TA06 bacterium DG_78]
MDIKVPYGKDEMLQVTLPEENVMSIVYPNKVEEQNETEILLKAIENPIHSKSFTDFLSDAKGVLFIANDGTRPTPTAKVLDIIYDKIKDKNIKFIIATGVHRGPTQEEFDFIFGKYYNTFKDRIHVHDSKKEEDMVHIGTSKNGTEMYVNRLGMEAHKIVIIGSVEPHYFGGYTGGRKSFLPGIASRKTIAQNHKHALKLEAQALALDGNPVHEDMIDALKTIADKEIFSIQTVLDGERRLYGVTCGHIHDSFYAAIDKAKEVFCVKIPEKADIVVSVAPYPMDIDLYQSQKALDNGKLALKEGGILIMVSKCRTGIGEPTFFELLSSSDSPQKALETIDKGYKLGYHKAAKMAEIGTWAEMWGVTDLEDNDMSAIFIKPFHDLQEALNKAIEKKGKNSKVIFLMDGSITVPMIERR